MISQISKYYNKDDLQATLNIICLLLGIGSLSMANNFASAGPIYGSIALVLMCSMNIYATLLLSKCLAAVPASASVQTFSDLGFYVNGKFGRLAVQITQLGTCLMVPIVFLILGGQLLLPAIAQSEFFDKTFIPTYWILVMGITLLPGALLKNLNEAYGVMITGTLSAFVAIVLAVSDSAAGQSWETYESTTVQLGNIFPVFGSMALSYGAAIILPTVQREHPSPSHMPIVIYSSLILISVLYFSIAVLGYSQYGCSAPGNLLTSMRDTVWKRLAYASMLVHVSIAFVVLLNPAVYYIERELFGINSKDDSLMDIIDEKQKIDPSSSYAVTKVLEVEAAAPYVQDMESERKDDVTHLRPHSILSLTGDDEGITVSYTKSQSIKSLIFRTTVVIIQVILAILGQGSFSDIADFIGATTMSCCCIILPCWFYYGMFKKQMSTPSKMLCFSVIIISITVGLYTAYWKMDKIIQEASKYELGKSPPPADENTEISYPFCSAGYPEWIKSKGL